jgi:hypothetical protein
VETLGAAFSTLLKQCGEVEAWRAGVDCGAGGGQVERVLAGDASHLRGVAGRAIIVEGAAGDGRAYGSAAYAVAV